MDCQVGRSSPAFPLFFDLSVYHKRWEKNNYNSRDNYRTLKRTHFSSNVDAVGGWVGSMHVLLDYTTTIHRGCLRGWVGSERIRAAVLLYSACDFVGGLACYEWVGEWVLLAPLRSYHYTVVWYQGYTRHVGSITAAVVSGSAKTKRLGNCTRALGPLAVPAAEDYMICALVYRYLQVFRVHPILAAAVLL